MQGKTLKTGINDNRTFDTDLDAIWNQMFGPKELTISQYYHSMYRIKDAIF